MHFRILKVLVWTSVMLYLPAADQAPAYLGPAQSIERRVEDLLSRLTLKEKVGQMNMPCVYEDALGPDIPMYVNDLVSSVTRPVRELKGFEKIILQAGEKRTVRFKLGCEELSFLDRNLEPVVEPGTFRVMAGSSCDDIRLSANFEV